MKWFRLMFLAALAGQLVWSGVAAERAAVTPESNKATLVPAPVLRSFEPPDSGLVTLPGPPPVSPAIKRIVPIPPVASLAPLPGKLVDDATLRQPVYPPLPAVVTARPRPDPLLEVGREVAAYCQRQIGHWKESDARMLFGNPKRRRPAYDEKKAANGAIYAFTDPTNQYKELELDFDGGTGLLRTVFAYPARLTWQECRRLWNGPVAAADANQGRKFYSYTNRRLDVLVDQTGKVISLGWY